MCSIPRQTQLTQWTCGSTTWKSCHWFPPCVEDIYLQLLCHSYLWEASPAVDRSHCQSVAHTLGKDLPYTWCSQTHSRAKQNKTFHILYPERRSLILMVLIILIHCRFYGYGIYTSHSYCPISASVAQMTVRHKIPLRASFTIECFCWLVNSLPSFNHLWKMDVFNIHNEQK